MAVLAVAVNFGAGESKALLALGGSVLAGLPVWLLYAWLRMSGAERRGRRGLRGGTGRCREPATTRRRPRPRLGRT